MNKCKNCGHEIGHLAHKYSAFGKSCIAKDGKGYTCGCTNPEHEAKEVRQKERDKYWRID